MSDAEREQLSDGDDVNGIHARHRREFKALRAQLQQLKKSATKGDKKRKKEVQLEMAQLETDLTERHKRELDEHERAEKGAAVADDGVDEIVVGVRLIDCPYECRLRR